MCRARVLLLSPWRSCRRAHGEPSRARLPRRAEALAADTRARAARARARARRYRHRATASSLALLAVAEPSLAADFVAKTAAGGNQIAEFIVPAGAKASAQGILGPPGAILAALIGLYTAATLGTSPLKVREFRAPGRTRHRAAVGGERQWRERWEWEGEGCVSGWSAAVGCGAALRAFAQPRGCLPRAARAQDGLPGRKMK